MKYKYRAMLFKMLLGTTASIALVNIILKEKTPPKNFNAYLSPLEKREIDYWLNVKQILEK